MPTPLDHLDIEYTRRLPARKYKGRLVVAMLVVDEHTGESTLVVNDEVKCTPERVMWWDALNDGIAKMRELYTRMMQMAQPDKPADNTVVNLRTHHSLKKIKEGK